MSNFWDSIMIPVETAEVVAVEKSDFWASIGLGVESKPVKQSKPKAVKKTAKKSKAVEEAVKVYETVEGLVVPTENCIHYWVIPAETAWAIGVCKLCQGERWFSNRYTEDSTFNTTLVPPKIQAEIEETLQIDADIRDITTVYKAEQDSAEGDE